MSDLIQSSPQRVRFGAFEVDLRAGELWKSGRKRKLTGQPFAVLATLLEHPGDVVSREELQKRLWPDTFVDVDHNLNAAINKIREALGDSPERPRYVETLSRRGYRFIAPVEVLEPSASSPEPVPFPETVESNDARSPEAVTSPKPRIWPKILAGAALAVGVLAAAWLLRPALPPPTVGGIEQLTQDGVQKLRFWGSPPPAMQTDGSTIYFVETSGYYDELMQVSREGGDTARISVPFVFYGIANIAPDRPELLIASEGISNNAADRPVPSKEGGESGLWRVPVPAGQPRPIGNLVASDAAFSPDGKTLYFIRGQDIFRANGDGSEPHKILSANGNPFWLRVSPDGRLLRFSLLKDQLVTSTLWETRPDGSSTRQLLAGWSPTNVCCGNWTGDGKYFVFQATDAGMANLWTIREKSEVWRKISRAPVQLTVGNANSQAPLPSRDGKKVFFLGETRHGELVRYDPATRKFTPYLSGLSAEGVAFSRDGKRVAYVTFPDGVLWEINADGSEKRQLSFPPMQVGLPQWSPDGTRIAFSGRMPGKTYQLYVVSAEGGGPEQLTTSDFDNDDGTWSPDGESLAFSGDPFFLRGSHAAAIHIMNLATRQITDVPGSAKLFSPRWSSDGRYLLAMTVDFQKLMLYDFAERKWEDLVTSHAITYPSWSHDGKCAYFAKPYAQNIPVYRVCLNDRKIEHIVDLSEAGRLAEGHFGRWTGLAPDDSILALHDTSIEEIYALDVKFPR